MGSVGHCAQGLYGRPAGTASNFLQLMFPFAELILT